MTAPKAKTFQEKFGFMDGELKTPLHDEIMFWLDGYLTQLVESKRPDNWGEGVDIESLKQHRLDVIKQEISTLPEDSYNPNIRYNLSNLKSLEVKKVGDDLLKWKPVELVKKWEYPITTGKEFVVGFVDMYFNFRWQSKCNVVFGGKDWNWELYIDAPVESRELYFEVKTSIPSVGELLRQINFYKEYLNKPTFVVVCPDDRFEDILKSQGVKFLKYPGKE